MRTRTAAIGVAAIGVVVLTACAGGSSKSASGGALSGGGANAAVPAPAKAAAAGPAYDATGNGSAERSSSSGGSSKTLLESSAVIRTASITVRVKRISTAEEVRAIAEGVGGSVDGDDRSSGEDATATLRLAVPPDRLGDVLSRIAKLGTEKSREMSSRDVTEEVADVASRVKSATESIDRLRLLFDQASNVSHVIAIERELSAREADLESLQAQQRALARQTSMAHVTVVLTTAAPAVATKKHHDHGGFIGGLGKGWDAFVDAGSATLTAVGVLLPFALVIAVIGAGVLYPLRRHRRRMPPPVPDAV